MKCPSCNGRKMTTVFGASLPCDQCGGEGDVTDEMIQWIQDGRKLRAQRLHSPDGMRSLVEESERRGIPIVDLSRMERGAIKPVLEVGAK